MVELKLEIVRLEKELDISKQRQIFLEKFVSSKYKDSKNDIEKYNILFYKVKSKMKIST